MAVPQKQNKVDTEEIYKLFVDNVPQLLNKYRLTTYLGKGHTSKVMRAETTNESGRRTNVAIKLIGSASSFSEVKIEVETLKKFLGCHNIVQYIEMYHNGNYTALVTNFLDSPSLRNVFLDFTPADVQVYMKNLLLGLYEVHSKGYIHGDIKPGNFLFSPKLDRFMLIDFGMAQKEGTQLYDRGTKGYKPPEVLLTYCCGTSVVDIWSAGCILASMLSGIYPFFYERGEYAFKEFCVIFGAQALERTGHLLYQTEFIKESIKGLEIQMSLDLQKLCLFFRKNPRLTAKGLPGMKCFNCKQYLNFCLCKYSMKYTMEDEMPACVYDLLGKMLCLNPMERISAKDALQHKFFQLSLDSSKPLYEKSHQRLKRGVVGALSAHWKENNTTEKISAVAANKQ